MTEEAIRHFLYETLGYRRIDDFVNGKKEKDTPFRKFLDGTILGTFGTRASPVCDSHDDTKRVPAWSRKYIMVPHIFLASELEDQIKRGKEYLHDLFGEDVLRPEIEKRKFFLSNYTAFVGYTRQNVDDRMKEIHKQEFPEAEYIFVRTGRFSGHIKEEDFHLFTEGSTSKSGAKLIVVSFNLPEDVVKDLNAITARYLHLAKNIK